MNLFIINTNKSTNKRYEHEMIGEQKCAAYRLTRKEIEQIQKGDRVLLYSNEVGIIARGVADGVLQKKEDCGEEDAEYFMKLENFYTYIKPISYTKTVDILKKAEPSFARPFNVTLLRFEQEVAKHIWMYVNQYV